jgi:uncharacterized protein YqeY
MSLFDTINADIKTAMLAKESLKLEALRAVKSALLLAKTEKGGSDELPPDVELKTLQKLVKQRRESAEIYVQQNRPDLAEVETLQANVIEGYLPKQLTEAEIAEAVKAIIAQVGASSAADLGKVMGVASKQLAGKADGKVVSQVVRQLLA